MPLTDDPNDPRLTHGPDTEPVPQAPVYLVLSEEERAKGFVRPLRLSYIHLGPPGPKFELRDLTEKEKATFNDRQNPYVKFEIYPEDKPGLGRFWTQAQLDAVNGGCGAQTTMDLALCETYARNPKFYGSTYCVRCSKHLPVDEFVWTEDGARVGS